MPERQSVKSIPIEATPKATELPVRHEKGRRCSTCSKLLSSWNAGPECYACEKAQADFRARLPLMLDRSGQ